MSVNQWGSDVPVSMPQPLPSDLQSLVPMGGFTMTEDGLFHDLSQADFERISRPTFSPFDPAGPVEHTEVTQDEVNREWT